MKIKCPNCGTKHWIFAWIKSIRCKCGEIIKG
jgi:ribosomal protein S27E